MKVIILAGLNIDTPYTVYVKVEDTDGNVVVSSNTTRTIDKTSPNIIINEKTVIDGLNGWKKSVVLESSTSDNYKVEKMKYCVGSTTCTPSTEVSLIDGKYDITLNTGENNQVLCVQAIDTFNNVSSNTCSPVYKVDDVDPILDTITATPNDDTMLVEVAATDTASKPYKYYFSKDSGATYIESINPNYTFMELDEGDYLVMAYVEDTAGNTSEAKPTTVTIKHAEFCRHNNIDNFGNCIIASEAKTTDIALAKQTIEAKGTPDFTKTSPAIQYEQKISTSNPTIPITSAKITVGTGYTFDSTTGYYLLTGKNLVVPDSIDYSKGNYYITSDTYSGSSKPTIYKITGITSSTNSTTGTITYTLTKTNYTSIVKSYDTSEVGMYSASDNEGKTYYYRGSVGGNYVKFADKYWRIIRVNGDGSVRMIYDGTSIYNNGEVTTNRQLTTNVFSEYDNDNTYIGYMYGDVSKFAETDSEDKTFNRTGLSATTKYVFGTSYEFVPASRSYKVSGITHTGVIGNDQIGYYTCFSTNPDGACKRLQYTTGYSKSGIYMKVKGIAYGTTSLADARENATDSTIKEYLETWYDNNLKSLEDKINLNTYFCNNRTKSEKNKDTYTNEGFGINPTIYGHERFYDWASQGILGPTLMCNDVNDRFSVTSVRGNGNLDASVGLITADEVNMAGGRTNSKNVLYYLYSGTDYWTITPSRFHKWFNSLEMNVSSIGDLSTKEVNTTSGVRPVINLRSDVGFTGTGTKEDPYVIK